MPYTYYMILAFIFLNARCELGQIGYCKVYVKMSHYGFKIKARWPSHIARVAEDSCVKSFLLGGERGKRRIDQPEKRWLEVKKDLRKVGATDWQKETKEMETKSH